MEQIYRGPTVKFEDGMDWVPGENRVVTQRRLDINDIDYILNIADKKNASDVTLQVGHPIWMDVYGKWERFNNRALSAGEIDDFLKRSYGETGPGEVVQRGRPLDYAYVVRGDEQKGLRNLRVRVNATGGRNPNSNAPQLSDGVQVTMRVLPGVPPTVQELGIEPEILGALKLGSGLTLITGPTGSGKTTLMGAIVRFIAENEANSAKIIEYSDPIELVYDELVFPHSFIHQLELGRGIKLPQEERRMIWAACVANAMRRKPTEIIIGEARDGASMEGCISAVLTGHGVKTTLHTIGVAETTRRVIMMFPPDQRDSAAIDLIETANMFMTQLLVPKIGGGRLAVREYAIFDAKARRKIINTPTEKWSSTIQDMMINKEMPSARMIDQAKLAFDKGLIAEEQYNYLAARQRSRDRQAARPIDLEGKQILENGLHDTASIQFHEELDIEHGIEFE